LALPVHEHHRRRRFFLAVLGTGGGVYGFDGAAGPDAPPIVPYTPMSADPPAAPAPRPTRSSR
jgi:hypothetical protein